MTQQDSIIQQDSYITIAEAGEGCYVESRSRFLAFALHAGSEEEVKEILAAFRKNTTMHAMFATPMCWAITETARARMMTGNLPEQQVRRWGVNCVPMDLPIRY